MRGEAPLARTEGQESEPALSPAVLWLVAIGLSLGPAVSNGFARFAYGLVLPAMRDDLGWSYAEAGALNTANAVGYLAGALLSLALISVLGARRLFVWGMAVTTVSLLFCALTRDFWLLIAWRTLAGIAGAPVFVAGSALAATLFRADPARNALAVGLYFGGGGLGQLLSGAALPPILERLGNEVWPQAWLLLAAGGAAAFIPAWFAANAQRAEESADAAGTAAPLPYARMLPALGGYFLFGLGYLIYLTFLVAWMRAEGAGATLVAGVWSLMAVGTMLSPFIWRRVLAAARGGGAMAASNLATGLGVLCALLLPAPFGVVVSAAVVGASFYIVPASASTFGRKNLTQAQWGRSFAAFTIVFSIGQMIGPVAAGALADAAGSIALGLASAGAILLAGAVVSVMQRPLSTA